MARQPPRAETMATTGTSGLHRGRGRTRSAALVVGGAALVLLTGNAQRIGVAPFLEDFRSLFDVDYAGVGALLTAYLLGYALAQLPAGLAADRCDPRRVALVGLAGLGVGALVLALTPSYPVALLARFAMGVAAGLLFPTAMKLATSAGAGHGLAVGVLEAGQGAGTLIGVTLIPLLAQATSMSDALVVLALMPPLVMLALRATVPPSQRPRTTGSQRAAMRALLGDRRFLALLPLAVLVLFAAYAAVGWLPTYARTTLGLDRGEAGWLMVAYTVAWFVAAPLAGRLADARGAHARVLALAGLLTLAACVLLLTGDRLLSLLAVALSGAGGAASISMLWALVSGTVGPERRGGALGLGNTAGQLASATSGLVYGSLLDLSGFGVVWTVAAAFALASALLALAVGRARRPA